MHRALQLVLSASVVLLGAALGATVYRVWQPCADAVLPLDPFVSPACAAVTSGANTAWIGLLWPVALIVAAYAGYRAIRRGWGAVGIVLVILLGTTAIAAMPLLEYFLLNAVPQSWDEPPGTGAFTALLFVLSGLVLAVTVQRPANART